jgi:hypothetical protein
MNNFLNYQSHDGVQLLSLKFRRNATNFSRERCHTKISLHCEIFHSCRHKIQIRTVICSLDYRCCEIPLKYLWKGQQMRSVVWRALQEAIKRIKVEEIGKGEAENNMGSLQSLYVVELQVRKKTGHSPQGVFGQTNEKRLAKHTQAIRSCRMCT